MSDQAVREVIEALNELGLKSLASRFGSGFRLDPQGELETITFSTKYVIQVVGTDFIIELFALSDDLFHQERFRRRVSGSLFGTTAWIATAEDVVIQKLRWYQLAHRRKDWDDVEGVMLVQRDRLDWAYIQNWCDQHGSREHLDALRASAGV